MARLARYVIPGQPQHIIQRGNNRQVICAADADYRFFRDALVAAAARHGLAIHAYVWMTNNVHVLVMAEFSHGIRSEALASHPRPTQAMPLRTTTVSTIPARSAGPDGCTSSRRLRPVVHPGGRPTRDTKSVEQDKDSLS
ncbi:MAG: hypothetical protein U5S82_04330 [Gammaproteobacteria bacterium]|nr:hypothetical protein [Gammaproteobacteria bacterium]